LPVPLLPGTENLRRRIVIEVCHSGYMERRIGIANLFEKRCVQGQSRADRR
jgi:hypothetical protein